MKQHKWLFGVGAVLLACSALTYFVHYLFFHDVHHIMIYLIGDIAFVPLEVLLVVVVIERVLSRHEKQSVLEKLNMLVGLFFSELGVELLGELTDAIENQDGLRPRLDVGGAWSASDFRRARAFVGAFDYKVNARQLDLAELRSMLLERRDLLANLLANPNLLEHERFTGLLWAIFHLMEELSARDSLTDLPETDLTHLAGDVARVYSRLTQEWLRYCEHLKHRYPYIFSIVVRTHPLQERPDATVR